MEPERRCDGGRGCRRSSEIPEGFEGTKTARTTPSESIRTGNRQIIGRLVSIDKCYKGVGGTRVGRLVNGARSFSVSRLDDAIEAVILLHSVSTSTSAASFAVPSPSNHERSGFGPTTRFPSSSSSAWVSRWSPPDQWSSSARTVGASLSPAA